jgi:diadenosine tetraphosphatase ApaH/serine/threonine PP2A family protein phosphatase
MKAAIISDIHSNLEALQAVLKDIKKRRIKSIYCLGDLVGYGANPNECIAIVGQESDATIAGNHDYAAVDMTDISTFNPVAAEAIRWTQKKLTDDSKKTLSKLPLTHSTGDLLLVHGSPNRPEQWHYLFALDDFHRQFSAFVEHLCFVGHSHIPSAVFQDANSYTDFLRENPFPLLKKRRYIINVGSVGQPRDLDPRASYAIYDGNNDSLEIVRVEYNIPLAEQKIVKAGLPEVLAERLSVGK